MANYEVRLQLSDSATEDALQEQHGNSTRCYHALLDHRGYIQAVSLDEYLTVSIPWQTGERIKKGEIRLSEAYDAAVERIEEVFECGLRDRDEHLFGTRDAFQSSQLFHKAHGL